MRSAVRGKGGGKEPSLVIPARVRHPRPSNGHGPAAAGNTRLSPGGRSASLGASNKACGLLAATLPRPGYEGGWRAEKRKILMARALNGIRGRLPARQSAAFPATGPAFVRSVALECADRSVSQLLAGTPSGPGGSSDAARVPRCDEARRRRTPSRLTTPHETPLEGRGDVHHKRGSARRGLCGHN